MPGTQRLVAKAVASNVRYYYFTTDKGGVVTVAVGRFEKSHYTGLAFCRPGERFVKQEGRIRALRRMMERVRGVDHYKNNSFVGAQNAHEAAVLAIKHCTGLPPWCTKGRNLYLR